MLCARAFVRALNDAKNRAQQGCAMQFSGITLTKCDMPIPQENSTYPAWGTIHPKEKLEPSGLWHTCRE